jgi:hypothetical protein
MGSNTDITNGVGLKRQVRVFARGLVAWLGTTQGAKSMTQQLLFFAMGFMAGAGFMGFAILCAAVIIGLGLNVKDLLSMETDPSMLAALGAMVAVFLFGLIVTQTHYLDHVCLIRSANGCWPGGN